MDFNKLLEIAAAVATKAGALGVPYIGLAGALAIGIEKVAGDVAVAEGTTREEVIAGTGIAGAANLLELAKDAAKGE